MTNGKPARTELPLDPAKFRDPFVTARGEERAWVSLTRLRKLWFNTGTLCNLTCRNCYIESSPRNDRLAYLSAAEVCVYLDEIKRDDLATEEIGFTGGEPFMTPEFPAMLQEALRRGFQVLVLTNAMRPMMKLRQQLLELNARFPGRLAIRVSLDRYGQTCHEFERGRRSWASALAGLVWLCRNGFAVQVAGRRFSGEPDPALRAGYARLFREHDLPIDASDAEQLVLFPEMDATRCSAAIWMGRRRQSGWESGVEHLGEEVRRRGMFWFHLPIVDVSPDEGFERDWASSGEALRALLRNGRDVLVHCRGGLGRAGTIAARLLIELGMEPEVAIRLIRAVRRGAIQTPEQERYVLGIRVAM